ncbi:AMP-binding protein [Streptomyces echinatus]|uniref:AMP-binding protein n=1 Tax=Streptomyces echinatus TaxID=67293 RepID=UPI0031F02BA4
MYTSGSTGAPKGVVVPHANVTRLFAATESWFHFGPDDVWTLFHSPSFDFSVWEIWGPLLHGGRLVVVSHETSRSPGNSGDCWPPKPSPCSIRRRRVPAAGRSGRRLPGRSRVTARRLRWRDPRSADAQRVVRTPRRPETAAGGTCTASPRRTVHVTYRPSTRPRTAV